MKIQALPVRLTLCGVLLGSLLVPLAIQAQAAPRPLTKLEIWPGQRVVMILPLSIGSDFQGGEELGRALILLVQQDLQNAVARTGKFSVMTPYRFDPILRRGVLENQLADADVTNLLNTPSLENAQNILGKLRFDQPSMVLESKIEELRVGGTAKQPTVQLQVSGRLYEVGGAGTPKNVVVTSRSFAGRTPEIRLQSAAAQAFSELAARLVEPPASFQLPAPVIVTPTPAPTATAPVAPTRPSAPAPIFIPPSNVEVKPPSALSPEAGAAFVPQLPPAQPPLNIAVGEATAGAR